MAESLDANLGGANPIRPDDKGIPFEHLGDARLLPPLFVTFCLLTLLMPYTLWRLWEMEAIGIGASPTYAISLLLSGAVYWGVALMQLIATHSGLWAIDPGGLRLAWMVLTQTGYALQSFAYSKLLRMWLGYSSGVGEFVQPPLRVPKVYDRFVTLFVTVVGLNYCCQLVIAGAYYDVHKAEEEEVLEGSRTHRPEPIEPYYIADLALKDVGELLDLLTDGLWFAVTVTLLLTIRVLRARELGEATRLELQQHNALVRTARVLFAVHFFAFCAQLAAFTPAGKGDGETIAEILQICWFVVQLWFQVKVMQHVYDTHVRSMAAFEARVLRATTERRNEEGKSEASDLLRAARSTDVFCNSGSLVSFGGGALLLAAVVATALALGAMLLHR